MPMKTRQEELEEELIKLSLDIRNGVNNVKNSSSLVQEQACWNALDETLETYVKCRVEKALLEKGVL